MDPQKAAQISARNIFQSKSSLHLVHLFTDRDLLNFWNKSFPLRLRLFIYMKLLVLESIIIDRNTDSRQRWSNQPKFQAIRELKLGEAPSEIFMHVKTNVNKWSVKCSIRMQMQLVVKCEENSFTRSNLRTLLVTNRSRPNRAERQAKISLQHRTKTNISFPANNWILVSNSHFWRNRGWTICKGE